MAPLGHHTYQNLYKTIAAASSTFIVIEWILDLEVCWNEAPCIKGRNFHRETFSQFRGFESVSQKLTFYSVLLLFCSWLNLIFSTKYSVLLSMFQNVLLHCSMVWTRTTTVNSCIRRIIQVLLNQSEICYISHYHMNIISKLIAEFVTALVEVVHFFSITINMISSINMFKPCKAKVL